MGASGRLQPVSVRQLPRAESEVQNATKQLPSVFRQLELSGVIAQHSAIEGNELERIVGHDG